MTPNEETIAGEGWLHHAAALRRLAASLLRDEHEADDLVQETWLRAQRNDAQKTPSWFRTVLRNLARDRMRERGRRRRTEHDAARTQQMPSEEQVAERLEVARRVAEEVARLDEPYRTAIHLRYFEDLTPEAIARASGVPVETVRTRIRRGLETLRRRMDQSHDGRREAWALALAPLAARVGPTTGGVLTAAGAIMSTKLVVGGAAAVVVALGLLFGVSRIRSSPPRSASEAPKQALLESELRTRISGALAATREVVPSSTPRVAPSAANAASVEVHGTVVIEDESGGEHANESGTLTIAHYQSEQDAVFQDVAVRDGTWTTSIPAGRNLIVAKLVGRDCEAVLPEPHPLPLGPDAIAVHGKWLAQGWLRVLDASTKQELREIEVRCANGWRANPIWTHPGDAAEVKTVVRGGVSPVTLPDRKWVTPYWVHAPGHAWARVDFDHRAGGQATVELSPLPSSVLVSIAGGAVPDNAFVRLYSTSDTFQQEGFVFRRPARPEHWMAAVSAHASTTGRTRIDDFQAGAFLAAVEVGEYESTMRIGEARVDVEAGGLSSVTIPIDPSELSVPRTHLYGILELPQGLDRTACRLRLQRDGGGEKVFGENLSEMSFNRGDESRLHWDAGLVRTGDYEVMVKGIQHRARIHAPGPGETKVVLTIPPLVKVRVDVVDAESGAKLDPERMRWEGPRPEGAKEFELVHLFRDPRSGFFDFVAPRGDVRVYCHHPGYRDVDKTLALIGPDFSCTIALERAP